MAKYSKQILSFCDVDKCEHFSFEQQYAVGYANKLDKPLGKTYYCSHPSLTQNGKFLRSPIVSLSCPKKTN